jgi:zinc and cadmium transporter
MAITWCAPGPVSSRARIIGVPLLATALGLSLLGSCGGLLVAGSLLLVTDAVRTRLLPWLVSYAVGALLGVALLALLPEALTTLDSATVFGTLLAGILVFFVLEKLVLLRHCHHADACAVHGATAPLVIIGDAFHNFIDGALICTAVLSSVPLGISTALAVAAHEIPQEVGDVAILLAAGYSRTRALLLNVASGLAGIAGTLLAYGAVEVVPSIRPYVLAFSSASLLYIAMSDLIPDLHRKGIDASGVRQVLLISAGIATIVVFEKLVG